MDALDQGQRIDDAAPLTADSLRGLGPVEQKALLKRATDELVRSPLWLFRPEHRPAVTHERRRRFGVYDDDE